MTNERYRLISTIALKCYPAAVSTAQELDLLLNDIEESCNPTLGSRPCSHFMLESLALIEKKLPPIAVQGAQVLNDYLSGRVRLDAVTDIKLKCWERIDECHRAGEQGSLEMSALRAVIFPLHVQEHTNEDEIVDHLSTFLAFLNRVEPHFAEEAALLRKHFPKAGQKAGILLPDVNE